MDERALRKLQRRIRVEELCVKLLISLSCVIMTAHIVLLCFGIESCVAECVCGYSIFGFFLLMGAAWVFRLCWLSWSMIVYVHVVQQCMFLKRVDFFGEFVHCERVVLLAIGLALCMRLVCDHKHYYSLYENYKKI